MARGSGDCYARKDFREDERPFPNLAPVDRIRALLMQGMGLSLQLIASLARSPSSNQGAVIIILTATAFPGEYSPWNPTASLLRSSRSALSVVS